MVPSLTFAVLFAGSSYATTFDAPVVRVEDGDSAATHDLDDDALLAEWTRRLIAAIEKRKVEGW